MSQPDATLLATMRLDAYIRVSQVRGRSGPSFISPTQQRERIEAWIAAFGHERGEIFEELDASGARADRPKLQAAIERIERGESDGIVVAKLDRFGRSLMDGLQLIDRIRDAGGTFASVQDGFDLGTDTGGLVLRIMFSMAEYELDRVRGGWYDARARAVMRGIHPSARTPFGYARKRQGTTPGGAPKYVGPLLRDPRTGPLVTELYRRRVEQRASHSELARWLTSLGVPTAAGRTSWSQRGVRDIIANRVYMGIAYASDVENPDAHPALIDRETWRLAQRAGQRTHPRSPHPSPLSGLMRCTGCRYVMRAERRRQARGEVWAFSCRSVSGAHAWTCHAPAYIAITDELEQLLVDPSLRRCPSSWRASDAQRRGSTRRRSRPSPRSRPSSNGGTMRASRRGSGWTSTSMGWPPVSACSRTRWPLWHANRPGRRHAPAQSAHRSQGPLARVDEGGAAAAAPGRAALRHGRS